MVLAHEQKQTKHKNSKISHLKKKITKFTCASQRRHTMGGQGKLTIEVDTFDYESFQRLILYIHCGSLTVDARSVVGKYRPSSLLLFSFFCNCKG